MALFDFLRRNKSVLTEKSLASPDTSLLQIFGLMDGNGSLIYPTPLTAMRCTPVRSAVLAISETLGNLPLDVFQRGADGSKTALTDHPVATLFNRAVNLWTSSQEFIQDVTQDALLHGDGFGLIVRVDGVPKGIYRLWPPSVFVRFDAGLEPSYTTTYAGQEVVYSYRDVIHIKAPGHRFPLENSQTSAVLGNSPVVQCRDAIALALLLERHGVSLFSKGGAPSGLLSTDATLGQDTASRIAASWKAAYGDGKSGGTAVLEQGMKFQQVSLSSVDSQYLELRNFMIAEISRVFRVPPVLLFDYSHSTWNASETMMRSFYDQCLATWLNRWESEIDLKLLDGTDTYSCFDRDELLQADTQARFAAYSSARTAGWLTANEVREREDYAPLPGGDKLENPNTSSNTGNAPKAQQ